MFIPWILLALVAAVMLAATAFASSRHARSASQGILAGACGMVIACGLAVYKADIVMDTSNRYEKLVLLVVCMLSIVIIALSLVELLANPKRKPN